MVAMPTLARVGWNPVRSHRDRRRVRLEGDLPGVKREDLGSPRPATAADQRRRASEQETKTETVFSYEREFGSFMRAFTLPASADIEHAKSELRTAS
jgi:HSP20 family molecular chaperone IbpA